VNRFLRATISALLTFACGSTSGVTATGSGVAVSVMVGTQSYACSAVQPHTGGSAGVGGSVSTGGAPGTGGALATGGKAATGGASASPGNTANCIAALSKDVALKNVAAQQGITIKTLATKMCADPNILSRYP